MASRRQQIPDRAACCPRPTGRDLPSATCRPRLAVRDLPPSPTTQRSLTWNY
jgi:hypothetical protein